MVHAAHRFSKRIGLVLLAVALLFAAGCSAGVNGAGGAPSSATVSVSPDDAKQIALKDAGVESAQATFVETKTDVEHGEQVYDLKFYTADAEYEYEIRVSDGSIYSRDVDRRAGGSPAPAASESSSISLDDAKQIALKDAGVESAQATFVETKTDVEHGEQVYDLKFYTADAEYEYEIRVSDGSIYSRDIDRRAGGGSPAPAASESGSISLDDAKQIALKDAGVESTQATFVETKTDVEHGQQVYDLKFYTADAEYEYEIRVSDGSIYSKNAERFPAASDAQPADGAPVDLETAKDIAVAHARVKADEVVFKKAVKEFDDGVEVFEIEFYFSGSEYDYTIRCADGKILEYEKN